MSNENDSLITFGLRHHDARVRELAAAFHDYRKVVSKFVGSEKPITIETSGERAPVYDRFWKTGPCYRF